LRCGGAEGLGWYAAYVDDRIEDRLSYTDVFGMQKVEYE
jgi:hypothetical protein